MPLQSVIEQTPDYLLVTLTGTWQPAPMLSLVDTLADECRQRGCQQVLIDGMAVQGNMPDFARYQVGERIAAVLGGVRVTLLVPQTTINKFAENVAVNRGARFFVTADRAAALGWLLNPHR